MMRTQRHRQAVWPALIAALLLAGCGGSSSVTVSHTSPPVPTVTQTVTTTPAASATTTATTSSTPTAVAGTACTAADLTPVFLGSNGATGHVVLSLALRNRGSSSCHTFGFPGIQFFSKAGVSVATDAVRSTEDLLGSAPEVAITLSPGKEASFRLVTSDVPSTGATCESAGALQIIAPDDTTPMRVVIPGIVECGETTVSPLEPGTSAIPGV